MINKMVKVLKNGPMELNMLDNIRMVKRMEEVSLLGMMVVNMMETS